MRLRALGRMEIRSGREWRPVKALKQRTLLGVLLVERGAPISVDRLVEELWGDEQPKDPANQIHLLVSRLRRLFDDTEAAVIETLRPGYRLALSAPEVDIGRFEELADRGVVALRDGANGAATETLSQALDLWRGPAFADTQAGRCLSDEAERLEERRLATLEARLEADLGLGRHAELIPALQAGVNENPFRERSCFLLMLALHRSGRQADALREYRSMFRRLDRDLGVRPGRALQDLHQRILDADPDLCPVGDDDHLPNLGASFERADPPAPPVPMELPQNLSSFTGREAETDQILAAADGGDRAPGRSTVCVIDGMAGVGKTAFAVHVAHRIAERFPGGTLFIDLHGFTEGLEAVSPYQALDHLLRAVGVPGGEIPDDVETRTALWRTRSAAARYLIVLDDAASAEQVRPLLPASKDSLVLITGRCRLTDLDDTVQISLGVLSGPEALSLFQKVARIARADDVMLAEVEQVTVLCGRLPLAIRLLATRLRHRPPWTVGDLARRLADDHGRLAELGTGRNNVAAAFDMSYDHLDADLQRLYRRLSHHPGADFDVHAAAAIADVPLGAADDGLERLVDANLLESRTYGRYVFHDLLRAHAASAAKVEESGPEREAAVRRMLDYYQCAASRALDMHTPAERCQRPDAPAPTTLTTPSFDPAGALRWLDAERSNLTAIVGYAAERGLLADVSRLCRYLHRYLRNSARIQEAVEIGRHYLSSARAVGDRVEEARALYCLGDVYGVTDNAAAVDHYRMALTCLPAEGYRADRAGVLLSLGVVLRDTARLTEADGCLSEALTLFRAIDDDVGEGLSLTGLAHLARYRGDLETARELAGRASRFAAGVNDHWGGGAAGQCLGLIDLELGRPDRALGSFETALSLHRRCRRRSAECLSLVGIANTMRELRRYDQSLEHGRLALRLATEIRNLNGQFEAHQAIGETLLALGRPDRATGHLCQALELATVLEQPRDQERSRDALERAQAEPGVDAPD